MWHAYTQMQWIWYAFTISMIMCLLACQSSHEHQRHMQALFVIHTHKVVATSSSTCIKPAVGHCMLVQLLCLLYPQYGRTALHWASFAGHTTAVRLLLDYGANVNAETTVSSCGVHWMVDRVRSIHRVLYMLDTYVYVSTDGFLY